MGAGVQKSRFVGRIVASFVTMIASALVIAAPGTPSSSTIHPSSSDTSITQGPQVWNLKNADIRAVIQTMSILTGKSFIVSPEVKGRVTLISHKPMSVNEMYHVFLSMLRMMNYSAVTSDTGVVKIVLAEKANTLSRQIATDNNPGSGDTVVVRVVPLNNVSATELVPVIRPLMSESASVTAYMPSNALIIAGTASNITRIVHLVRQMDQSDINQIRVIHVHYANAVKVVSVIKKLQAASASQGRVNNMSLAADESGNNILVNANAANQLLVKHLVNELDRKSTDGSDTRVVKLNYLTAKKIAPILTRVVQNNGTPASTTSDAKTANATPELGGNNTQVSIQAESNNNALIIHAPASVMTSLLRVIRTLDHRPQEVLVEAIIVKVNESMLNKLGIIWGAVNAGGQLVGSGSTPTSVQDGSVTTPPDNSFQLKIGSNGSVGFLPTDNLGVLLHLLKSNGSSDVLATPSIVVLNNQKATIDDGQNLGLANRVYQGGAVPTGGDQSVTPFNTVQRTNVTLSLEVTPHISPNKMIRMDLIQKDDSVDNSASSNGNPDNPTLNTSQIKTSVLVKSGRILVLGGLIQNQQEKNVQKIPILGDLPLLGHLFRYNTHQMQKTSLMVFIRPIVMNHQSAYTQTRRRYTYMRNEQYRAETHPIERRHLPMLPKLNRQGPVDLLPPAMSVSLPAPTNWQPKKHDVNRDPKKWDSNNGK